MMSLARRVAAIAVAVGSAIAQANAARIDELASPDHEVCVRAYEALWRNLHPDDVPLLVQRIDDLPPHGRDCALLLLRKHPIVPHHTLGALLTSKHPLVRCVAAATLGRDGHPVALARLRRSIPALAPEERMALLDALGPIDDERVVAAVLAFLTADVPEDLAVATLAWLRTMKRSPSANTATVAAVETLVAGKDLPAHAAALAWRVRRGDEAAAGALAALLTAAPVRTWRLLPLLTADLAYPPALVAALLQALPSATRAEDVVQLAAALQPLAGDRLMGVLRAQIGNPNPGLRRGAMLALARQSTTLDEKVARAMLQEPAPEVQVVAAESLRRRDDPSGLPILLAIAREPGDHRTAAIDALGKFRAREAVEVLLDALDATDQPTRTAAWWALHALLPKLFPYRTIALSTCGYEPSYAADARRPGITALRRWWTSVQ